MHRGVPLLRARRPVLFYANGIGDDVMTLPALRALAAAFAGRARLLTAASPQAYLFDELPVAQRLDVPMQLQADGARSFDADAAARAVGACDLVVSLVPWRSPSLDRLLALLAPERSVGAVGAFGVTVPGHGTMHAARAAFEVARAVLPGASFEAHAQPPRYPVAARAAAARLRARLPPSARVLAVHAETTARKTWPLERFRAVVDAYLRADPDRFAFVVGTRAAPPFEPFDTTGRVLDCAGLPLPQSCALVAASDLFLGVDSAMLHVADFARVPSVALFGPTDPAQFGPLFAPHRTLRGAPAPGGAPATAAIAAADVLAALHELDGAAPPAAG